MTGEATAAKESTGGRREQCNIVAMPGTLPESKTSTSHKTVRSGAIYDFDMQERRRESLERAEKLKAELGDEPITGTDDRIAYRFVKRVFDFAFSAAVLVLLSWLFVIIAILVKVDDPKGPVFFKQTRVGKNGREFEMLKFRSMCVDAEEKLADLKELNEKTGPVFKIAEDPRITRVGKWLRKLSLDELPQFINVLRSDMSVVGPRPALPNEVAAYNDYQRQRLLVKPGMTCYWQTRRNRDSITFDEWVDLDLSRGTSAARSPTTSAPRCLARSSTGTAAALRRGSDIVTICGLPTFMRAISTRRRRRALSDKFTCLRRGAVAPRAAEAMLAPCPLRSFHGSFLFNGGVGGIHFPQVLIRGTRVAVCLVTSCRRSFFRYSCRLMNRSVSSYER